MTTVPSIQLGKQWAIVAGTIVILFGGIISIAAFVEPPPKLVAGAMAPVFHATVVSGPTHATSLDGFRGKVVVLNVWSTTCIPCVKEMPSLQRLSAMFADSGVRVVGIATDKNAVPSAAVAEFARQRGVTFDILRDPTGALERAYQVSGVPNTTVIDPSGRIVFREFGGVDWSDTFHVALVRRALERARPTP
ncbi:MAG: TlpA disulfide reductase family protein [Gemmatimonadota bacterium]